MDSKFERTKSFLRAGIWVLCDRLRTYDQIELDAAELLLPYNL